VFRRAALSELHGERQSKIKAEKQYPLYSSLIDHWYAIGLDQPNGIVISMPAL
jgi:hypothetical protein